MDEIIAECRFTLTKKMFYEGSARAWRAGAGKESRRMLLPLAVLWAVMMIWVLLRGGSPVFVVMETLVLLAVAAWILYFLPHGRAKRAFRKMEEDGTAYAERAACFYQDRLEVSAGEKHLSVPYGSIEKNLETPNLRILITKEGKGILLVRGSFVKGSEREALGLIGER